MTFDLNVIATGLAAPVAVLIVKTLLDFSLAHYFVKYFFWLPVRGFFRDHPQDLSGKWEQTWEPGGSETFINPTDRHSYTHIKQFGRYVYAEFDSKGRTYCMFGKIRNGYVIGEWFDKADRYAYFGAMQLRIAGGNVLKGLYIGHSFRTSEVGYDKWNWQKHSE
ncbi:hypothetical protein [Aeromonas veronii]|uniref:hypothetical protein n=1 Tax=Aeromonas veronii TaxID=654 RepID=UPI002F3FB83E